jgi:hypothetical protein
VGAVYRDENEAAIAAVSRLRDENAELRSQLTAVRRRVETLERLTGLVQPRSLRWPLVAGVTGAGLLAMAVAFSAVRVHRVATTASQVTPTVAGQDSTPTAPPLPTLGDVIHQPLPPRYDSSDTPVAPSDRGSGFDRATATTVLAGIDMSSCARAGHPGETGHAVITFSPSGTVRTAEIDRGQFLDAPIAQCALRKFRSARIPPFTGDPVKVGKTFFVGPARPESQLDAR